MPGKTSKMLKPGDARGRAMAKKNGRSSRRRSQKRLHARFGPGAVLLTSGSEGLHCPLSQVSLTRFTASGYCYTTTGAGTGDYVWVVPGNYLRFPFANMTTGLTWSGLTPASYNPIGYSTLLSSTAYTRALVYETMLELDFVPQSVSDSVTVCVTPSDQAFVPGTVAAAMAAPRTKVMSFTTGRVSHLGDYPFKYRFQPHKYVGIPSLIYDNNISQYSTFWNGAPGNILYLVINAETGDNATLSTALEIRVRQTFWVKLFTLDTSAMISMPSHAERRAAREEALGSLRIPEGLLDTPPTPTSGFEKLDIAEHKCSCAKK